MSSKMTPGEWFPLLGLTFSAFIFNTSEFIPIGLLTDIAAEFRTSEAHAGLLISVYAWVVTLLSLPLMLLVCRMEFRRLLLATVALFALCQVLSAASTGYYVLMLSRIGVACSHAVFWSIASPLAVRVVSPRHRSLALSLIVTGTSVAMIVGLPLGRIIGLHIGWRMTFLCVAVAAFAILLYLAAVFPKVPSRKTFSVRQLPQLAHNRSLIGIYLLSLAIATSYYTAYSYIEPFLKQVAALADGWITFTLVIFGAAGLLGSLAFSRWYDKHPSAFGGTVTAGVALALLLLLPAAGRPATVIPLCAFWGMSVTAFNVVFQAEIIKCTPQDATSVAMSVFSGLFNLGIGCGTLLGGLVCTYFSLAYVGYVGGVLAILAILYCTQVLLKRLRANGQ